MALSKHIVSRYCDWVVIGGSVLLLVCTPLAFGSVHPWAFSAMEAGVFALVVVWMGKVFIGGGEENNSLRTFGLPLLAFLGMVHFQLVPLPPSVLRLLAPAT